ncbi:SDR family NAD(P)-dependent oxidoreductase [Candidatus Protofrankia californiensis]|uniref:SDR family NAD(P)-dependent oxidoreductase n=1 Tax=Candidatus Protofrankia californiensis TaxID=1839754 RepID=UPI0013EC8ADB|nr:SDR family oxidoreductase [Candidatus Protofrankia californiensis]
MAIVTGASKGIGRTFAIGLAKAGANLVVNFKNDHRGADETCSLVRQFGRKAVAIGADVGQRNDVERLISGTIDNFGRLDVLVNNAGRTRFGLASDATQEDWDDVMNTNLRGSFFATVSAAQVMGDHGSVINISSCAATLMIENHSLYTTSKGGLEAMTRQLALELAPRIRVNAIAPAATSTERNWEYDPDFDRSWQRVTPMRRVATPEDFVGPLIFLASDASAFVTGEVLHVDGGWTIKGDYPSMAHYDLEADRKRG